MNLNDYSIEYKITTTNQTLPGRFQKYNNDFYLDIESEFNSIKIIKTQWFRNNIEVRKLENYKIIEHLRDGIYIQFIDKPIDDTYIKNNLIHKSIYNMILNRIKNKISYDDLLT